MIYRTYATTAALNAQGIDPSVPGSTIPTLGHSSIMEETAAAETREQLPFEAVKEMKEDSFEVPEVEEKMQVDVVAVVAEEKVVEKLSETNKEPLLSAPTVEPVVSSVIPTTTTTTTTRTSGLRPLSLSSSVGSLRLPSQIPLPSHHHHQQHQQRRASSSPKNHQRSISLTSDTSSISLLGVPISTQLHALKARNSQLETMMNLQSAQHQAAMFKATSRISSLEKKIEDVNNINNKEGVGQGNLDAEGWESEANRLQLELDGEPERVLIALQKDKEEKERLECELELEKSKRRTYKFLCAKLRCELHNRKGKEKWDLGVMDAADRARDIQEVKLEAEIAELRMKVGFGQIDLEEMEETIRRQRKKISALSATRSTLLDSVNTCESTITSLRSELSIAKSSSSKENKALTKESNSLKASLKQVEAEAQEEKQDLKEEIKGLKAEVLRLEKGEKKSEAKEAKELIEAKKTLEKEKLKREKLEGEIKELKTELKNAQAATKLASKQAAVPAASRRPRAATPDAPEPVEEAEVIEEEEEDDEPAPAPIATKSKPKKASTPLLTSDVDEDSGANYRPQKSKSRAVVLPQKTKAIVAAAVSDVSAELSSMAAAGGKKRKMLGDKSANSPKKAKIVAEEEEAYTGVSVSAATAKGKKTLIVKKKIEKVMPEDEEEEEEEAPKVQKKKKRTLFSKATGGKFAWSSIENADVNSLGLPSHLSPIKGAGGASSAFGLGRPSASLGILGRGLSGGRKSIFG